MFLDVREVVRGDKSCKTQTPEVRTPRLSTLTEALMECQSH